MMLTDHRHVFFLGIGGIGMSALARFSLEHGLRVSGYDRHRSDITRALEAAGCDIVYEDRSDAIREMPDLVIYTPAIPEDSALRGFFVARGVPMIKRSEALGDVTAGIDTIAVAGTHGKTTTSSMVSWLLTSAEIHHTAILGGISANYRSNYRSESLRLVVTEADEYDRSFHRLYPTYAVVTAMDPDHLDIYGTEEAMLEAYRQFIRQIQPGGVLLYRAGLEAQIGDELFGELQAKAVTVTSFGMDEGDYRTSNLYVDDGVWHWTLHAPGEDSDGLALSMPGRHNVLNATAAAALAMIVGATGDQLRQGMAEYKGVSRRFEIRYRHNGHTVIDDYAHHPEELEAAIAAARETFGPPVTGVFQPHLYSRTRDLAEGFAAALDKLDVPVLIDIYPAREEPIPGVSSRSIYDLMTNPDKVYLPGDQWVEWIIQQRPPTLITLGAGDLDKHIPEVIRRLYGTNE